jgi:hypothetical protein
MSHWQVLGLVPARCLPARMKFAVAQTGARESRGGTCQELGLARSTTCTGARRAYFRRRTSRTRLRLRADTPLRIPTMRCARARARACHGERSIDSSHAPRAERSVPHVPCIVTRRRRTAGAATWPAAASRAPSADDVRRPRQRRASRTGPAAVRGRGAGRCRCRAGRRPIPRTGAPPCPAPRCPPAAAPLPSPPRARTCTPHAHGYARLSLSRGALLLHCTPRCRVGRRRR